MFPYFEFFTEFFYPKSLEKQAQQWAGRTVRKRAVYFTVGVPDSGCRRFWTPNGVTTCFVILNPQKNLAMNSRDKIVELSEKGFCVLGTQFPAPLIHACREAFWPILINYLKTNGEKPNRGLHRHFLPMPFNHPCFTPEFFFDAGVLNLVRGAMDERIVADQWGCDVPVRGSENQETHVDYQRALFAELPDLLLPPYMLVVSFGLVRITNSHGPIQIAPGTHRMSREEGVRAVQSAEIEMQSVPLEIGDVLIRHPWALHRGTPNSTDTPRALATIRYVRRWFADSSREINSMPQDIWRSLTPEQQNIMRFPVED